MQSVYLSCYVDKCERCSLSLLELVFVIKVSRSNWTELAWRGRGGGE